MDAPQELTAILERLAAGEIDTAQAARLIDQLPPAPPAPSDGEVADGGEVVHRPHTEQTDERAGRAQFASFLREALHRGGADRQAPQVERLVVRGVGRRVRVVADAAVATVSVEGPHVLRRVDRVVEVTSDGEIGPSFDGFSIIRPPRSVEDLRNLSLGKQLVVRVNPAIPVDAEVTGGSLAFRQVPVLGKVRLSAGSMRASGVTQVDDCLVQMGAATIAGAFTEGRSRLRVESGSLTLRLAPESSVAIRAEAQLGGVTWPGDQAYDEYIMGDGTARIDLAVVMGRAVIRQELTPEEADLAEAARQEARRVAEEARAEAKKTRRAARAKTAAERREAGDGDAEPVPPDGGGEPAAASEAAADGADPAVDTDTDEEVRP